MNQNKKSSKKQFKMSAIIDKQIRNNMDQIYEQRAQQQQEYSMLQYQSLKFKVHLKIKQEKLFSDRIQRLFITKGFQCIKTNNKYDTLFLHYNILFFCEKKNLTNFDYQFYQEKLLQIYGKLYVVEFDKDRNPKFLIQEGIFDINLGQKQFLLNGFGLEFCGKSINLKNYGYFINGQFLLPIQKQQIKLNTNTYRQRKIIIIDQETQQQVNFEITSNNANTHFNHNNIVWCKYNQQLNLNDIKILNQRQWLTSSIIDSFVLFLNLQNENNYYHLKQEDRSKISRLLLIPTNVTTSFGEFYDQEKAKSIFYQELLQFSDLGYDLSRIYDQIGFPINRKNQHWYFLLFNLKQNTLEYYDSLKTIFFDSLLLTTLAKLLNRTTFELKIQNQFQQQRDSYSCGYRICSLMEYFSQKQFNPYNDYVYHEQRIVQSLFEVIRKVE